MISQILGCVLFNEFQQISRIILDRLTYKKLLFSAGLDDIKLFVWLDFNSFGILYPIVSNIGKLIFVPHFKPFHTRGRLFCKFIRHTPGGRDISARSDKYSAGLDVKMWGSELWSLRPLLPKLF